MGAAGERVGRSARQAMEQPGIGALSSVEKMRLMTEEVGVRLPRALLRLAAESKIATAAVNALGTAMMGVAAIQIGGMLTMQLYEEAKKLYEKWLDVDGAIQRYNDKAAEAAQQEFDKNRSLSQLNADLTTAIGLIDDFNRRKQVAQDWNVSWGQFGRELGSSLTSIATLGQIPYKYHFSVADANALNAATGQSDVDKAGIETKRHEQALREIQDNARVAESKVKGIDKARLAEKAADDEALENTKNKFNVQNQFAAISERAGKKPGEAGYVPRPGAHDFDEEQNEAHAHAAAEFQAALNSQRQSGANQDRSNTNELRRLHEEALESGLRLEAQDEEIRRMRQQTALGSLTGVARIQQEGQNRLADIYLNQNLDPGQRLAEIHEAVQQTSQAIAKETQDFTDRVNSIVAQSADRSVSGFARIHADAQREIDQLEAEAREKGGDPEVLARGEAAYRKSEANQAGDLMRKNAEETEQIEAQARAKFLSAEKQQTAAIETEYEQRLRKFQDEKDKELASGKLTAQEMASVEDDYNRRVVAAGQLRDAQMVESAERAREKMAGEFTSLFHSLDHPMKALADLGDKVAGQAAAALTQRLQTHFGGPAAAAQSPGGMLGGVFDKIAGTPHAHGAQAPGAGAAHSTAASAVISLGTAQISIQSASVAFGGGGAMTSRAGAGGGASSGGGSGSTFLLGSSVGSTGSTGSAISSGATAGGAGAGAGGAGGVIGDVREGANLFGQAKGIFGGGTSGGGGWSAGGSTSGGSDLDQIPLQPMQNFNVNQMATGTSNGGMLGGGGIMGNAGGAIGGGLGLFNAFEGSGGVGGALSGAMSGMQFGMSLGGPIGAAIGAAGGAIMGAIGFGGREKARVYWLKTIHPRIVGDTLGYQQGTMDYTSAYSDMQSADADAKTAMRKMGSAEGSYYDGTVHPAIVQAEGKLTAEQRAGRSMYTPGAAQFAMGSDSIPQTGMAVVHEGERIVPSDQNERMTRAFENGLGGSADSSTRPAQTGFGGDVHLHVSAIDARGVAQFFDQNKHLMRAKLNASFAENSGGADAY
jgi:hypothetical protein